MSKSADLPAGHQVGPYRISYKVSEGGMGQVYAAVHERIGRRVAIKVLHAHCARDQDVVRRFFNEARAVNLIDHPGLVQVHDFDTLDDGTSYLVMELLRGESLAKKLERCPQGLPAEEVAWLGTQIADTLAAVHANEIVHRDLKPNNIMVVRDPLVGRERTKVLDFGIAKLGDELLLPGQRATSTNVMVGTLLYIAPEQCRSARRVDGKADVYSLGIMLYEMLSGEPPFLGDSEVAQITMHLHDEPRPLIEVAPSVPPELAALVHSMLRKNKDARPTMAEVGVRLQQLDPGTPSTANTPVEPRARIELGFAQTLTAPPGLSGAPAQPTRRRGAWMGAALLGITGVALLAGVQIGSRQERRVAAARLSQAVAAPPVAAPPAVAPPAAPAIAPVARANPPEAAPPNAPTGSMPTASGPGTGISAPPPPAAAVGAAPPTVTSAPSVPSAPAGTDKKPPAAPQINKRPLARTKAGPQPASVKHDTTRTIDD